MTMDRQTRVLRNSFMVGLYLLGALWGVRIAVLPPDATLDVGFGILMAIAAVASCVYDSRLVGKTIVRSILWLMLIAWPVAVPSYLIWSRGWKGVFLTAMHAVLFYLVFLGTYYGMSFLKWSAA